MSAATPVVVFNLGVPVPVYHRPTPHESLVNTPTERRLRYCVGCGRLLREWSWNPSDRYAEQWEEMNQHTYLRTDHAEKIGRPCRQCYPDSGAS